MEKDRVKRLPTENKLETKMALAEKKNQQKEAKWEKKCAYKEGKVFDEDHVSKEVRAS